MTSVIIENLIDNEVRFRIMYGRVKDYSSLSMLVTKQRNLHYFLDIIIKLCNTYNWSFKTINNDYIKKYIDKKQKKYKSKSK
ncbi:hypothetical protein [Haloplasma contractile]|uniref:Uncharacterized protein n=1 Tax=Haloplasma contractile SSD-17B TaxID=1033810 RepID=U2EGG5_9MOLU|nr:hypothetical protein [Haloplasma contractile]ERJ13706.1 hypothetical protein HLPCO_000372 [Haloplasma contractile SSD-17B]